MVSFRGVDALRRPCSPGHFHPQRHAAQAFTRHPPSKPTESNVLERRAVEHNLQRFALAKAGELAARRREANVVRGELKGGAGPVKKGPSGSV